MKRKPRSQTLAAVLDRCEWDYSCATDRSFLLSSVELTFDSVAWEVAPQHLAPAPPDQTAEGAGRSPGDYDTRPLDRLADKG